MSASSALSAPDKSRTASARRSVGVASESVWRMRVSVVIGGLLGLGGGHRRGTARAAPQVGWRYCDVKRVVCMAVIGSVDQFGSHRQVEHRDEARVIVLQHELAVVEVGDRPDQRESKPGAFLAAA